MVSTLYADLMHVQMFSGEGDSGEVDEVKGFADPALGLVDERDVVSPKAAIMPAALPKRPRFVEARSPKKKPGGRACRSSGCRWRGIRGDGAVAVAAV
ncbi:uncharacterized protein A4U43_C05F21210 [Asparagus officinalis]|uniref:Uncharacterized protein n=1 Tax=Asparagus officinalis TaxID=4686 RepID=A0A5P1EXP7_ASPOF|nr:uncharacterized protein A4U43_C05F21210 [Asparagus officinalis]